MTSTTSSILASIFVILSFFASFCHTAFAEPVLIQSRSGQVGHGWLFGAPQDGQCWVAAPAHVVASPETGELLPFYFVDSRGVSGECEKPFFQDTANSTSLADAEGRDLSFARVAIGRADGECRSRLGLPSLGYQSAMLKANGFVAVSQFQTSAGGLPLTLHRRSVDSFGGAVVDFKPSGNVPQGSLRKGISGSPVVTEIGGQTVPVAMILRINPDTGVLRTLRFDYIKEQFNKIRTQRVDGNPTPIHMEGIPYRILQTSYIPASGDLGALSLLQENGCWAAKAPEGKKTAELVIAIDGQTRIKILELLRTPSCGSTPLHVWVDQRVQENATWEYVTAYKSNSPESASFRIELSPPRQIRLRFEAKEPISIQGIRLQ